MPKATRHLRHVWVIVREHISGWVVGGIVLAITGFAPEHWVADLFQNIKVPDQVRRLWPGFDVRTVIVFAGVCLILWDLLLRRRLQEFRSAAAKGSDTDAQPRPTLDNSSETAVGKAPMPSSALPLPDKPSIAVLPFQNMSGDTEQEYFADGMVEDIITSLSRMRWLFVIARNSSFAYKGRTVDVKQIGHDLGIRYLVEGSVRKAANRIRITAQLIDTSTGAHLWADRFDGGLEDAFDLQDKVAISVVGAIAPKLQQAEIERAKRKPTENLDAYDYYIRGMARAYLSTRAAGDEARQLFCKAIELDPDFASAHGMAAWCYAQRKANGWMADRVQETAEAIRLARRAVELGPDDPVALAQGGFALVFMIGDLDAGAVMIDRALALDPNMAQAWFFSGFVNNFLGKPEVAIEHLARAMRLSPLDPLIFAMHGGTAYAHFLAGRYDEALPWVEKALSENLNHGLANRIAAACYALAGRQQEAQKAAARLLQLDPSFRVANLKDYVPFRRPEDLAKLADGLRKAGLPE